MTHVYSELVETEDAWEEEFTRPFREVQEKLLSLQDVNVTDCRQMQRALATLSSLRDDMWTFANDIDVEFCFGLTQAEVHGFVNAYARQLRQLREHGGVDPRAAARSLRTCTRLATFFLLFMFDYYSALSHVELQPTVVTITAS